MVEELMRIIYQHFLCRPNYQSTHYLRIVDFVDAFSSKAKDVTNYAQFYMAPFLPEYLSLGEQVFPLPETPFGITEEELMEAVVALPKNYEFCKRFKMMMGTRRIKTCYKCCMLLILLVIKSNYFYFKRAFFKLSPQDPMDVRIFDNYLTQILLCCFTGVSDKKNRHAFMHKSYKLMLSTRDFMKELGQLLDDLEKYVYITIDQEFFNRFHPNYWVNAPRYERGYSPKIATNAYMIGIGVWVDDPATLLLREKAVYIYFHRSMQRDYTPRATYEKIWMYPSNSRAQFLVLCDKRNLMPFYVRLTDFMVTGLRLCGYDRLDHVEGAVRE